MYLTCILDQFNLFDIWLYNFNIYAKILQSTRTVLCFNITFQFSLSFCMHSCDFFLHLNIDFLLLYHQTIKIVFISFILCDFDISFINFLSYISKFLHNCSLLHLRMLFYIALWVINQLLESFFQGRFKMFLGRLSCPWRTPLAIALFMLLFIKQKLKFSLNSISTK